jgi:hypothetical protein
MEGLQERMLAGKGEAPAGAGIAEARSAKEIAFWNRRLINAGSLSDVLVFRRAGEKSHVLAKIQVQYFRVDTLVRRPLQWARVFYPERQVRRYCG